MVSMTYKGALMVKMPSMMEARARRIKALMEKFTENLFKLGSELSEAREEFARAANDTSLEGSFRRVKHGGRTLWEQWLAKEVGISVGHAEKLIKIYAKFGKMAIKPKLSFNVLDYLTQKQVPEAGRTEVTLRSAMGEPISKKKARKIVAQHLPKPKEAARIARETGKLVLASDDKYYTGATEEEGKEIDKRIEIVYGVRRAVETLAKMEMSPHEFLGYAQPHQLWRKNEEHLLTDSLGWLQALYTAWQRR